MIFTVIIVDIAVITIVVNDTVTAISISADTTVSILTKLAPSVPSFAWHMVVVFTVTIVVIAVVVVVNNTMTETIGCRHIWSADTTVSQPCQNVGCVRADMWLCACSTNDLQLCINCINQPMRLL